MTAFRNMAAALVLLIAFNDAAFGCAACFGASAPATLRAYYISTILLSAMPFAIIACFIFLLRRYRLGGDTSSRKQ
jgi:hypothetical protein